MKTSVAVFSTLVSKTIYLPLVVALAISGCGGGGGGGGDGGTVETPTPSPETATPTPTPVVSTPTPTATPTVTPTPTPVLTAVALSGSVSSFPDLSASGATKAARKSYHAGAYKSATSPSTISYAGDLEDGSFDRGDMVPAPALVSIFLLSDINFENPIATVPTDENGVYEVRVDDVREYLIAESLVAADDDEATMMAAFRALGQLQVRALVVRSNEGVKSALAIQSIADPNNLDDTGTPVPVVVDPIVHRIVKTLVDQIKGAISSLGDLGIADETVRSLTETIISDVAEEITRVVEEAADSIIEIPEGQNIEDVIAQQENEFKISVSDDQITDLEGVIDGTIDDPDMAISELEGGVLNADEVVSDEDSNLVSSLASDEQGLLAGLNSVLDESVNEGVDQAIIDATENGTLEDIFNLDGGITPEQALAAQALERAKQLRDSLRRLFLSMGLGVVVDENAAGDAGVIAIAMPSPFHIPDDLLPGARGFGDRNIRIFKVGSGDLDVGEYTSDPSAVLGQENGPRYYAPALSDVISDLIGDQTFDAFQQAVSDAFDEISNPLGNPTQNDFELVDRLRVFHDLNRRLQDASLVSTNVVDALVDNKDTTLKIKRLAAVIAESFTWAKEGVNITPEGFPIYTGRVAGLEGGADVIDSSELVRALSISLGSEASEAADQLTSRESFYAPFGGDAVQAAFQRASFAAGDTAFNIEAVLLDIYPENAADYRDLILGTATTPSSPDYLRVRDLVARGLTSAVPSSLFGQTLTSESDINIRSALFFLNFLLSGEYLIDADEGFFTEVEIGSALRFVPNFSNIKFLRGGDSVSVASLISQLLDITLIQNGDFHGLASEDVSAGLPGLPELPEFKQTNVEDFQDDLSPREDFVSVSCTVERFDGQDPAAGDNPLVLDLFSVSYNADTGEFFKGDALGLDIQSELVPGEGPVRRTYTISGVPSALSPGAYGRDYVARFDIENYQNDLPELFFWVDGFVPELNLCDEQYPLLIGPDQQFVPVPGLGLVSDQSRPGVGGELLQEGVDVSNFEEPGAPIYLTSDEEGEGLGEADFTFDTSADGYAITAATDGVGFAQLYGGYVEGELQVSIDSSGLEPLHGLISLLGNNIRDALEAVIADDSTLSDSVALDPDSFDSDKLYLMRDAEGKFWVLEARFLDTFEENGAESAFIDIGIASVNSLGVVGVPQAAFDEFPSEPSDGANLFFQNMLYGDWSVLDAPTGYEGPNLLEAQEVSFGGNEAIYDALESASDGIVIRYASSHFEENITSINDFDSVFGTPPDYSNVPVRIDAGRDGVTFVKLSFNKNNLTWVMEPSPGSASSFVTNLDDGDLVAVFSDQADDTDSPVYIGRVIRHLPEGDPFANFEIALEWIRFADVQGGLPDGQLDPREVVCFTENAASGCAENHPPLYFSDDPDNAVGTIFDLDFDGVPALFDANDGDPNVPGSTGSGAPGGSSEGLHISAFAKSGSQGQGFLLETFNIYSGDIQVVNITSDVFGADAGEQAVFSCIPPSQSGGQFTDFSCTSRDVAGGVNIVSEFQNAERVGFILNVPAETMVNLSDRIAFEYEILFRAPVDLAGNPLTCGDVDCLSRPAVRGSTSALVPEQVVVLDDLVVTVGTGSPESLRNLSSLDVTREFVIAGDAIPGAFEYTLAIYCPASQPGEPWFPEENLSFFAPARDATGREIGAEFFIDAPYIGGRRCDVSFNARLENDAGEFVGVSAISIEEVTTTGGGGNVDNELDLLLNQHVCVNESADGQLVPEVTDTCDTANILFTVTELQDDADGNQATLTLGAGVLDASSDGGRIELTNGSLVDGAVVTFDVDLMVPEGNIVPPTCGVISMDSFSDTCTNGELNSVSTDLFEVVGGELIIASGVSAPLELRDHGDVVSAISIAQGGFFEMVDPTDGQTIMEIEISSFPTSDGGVESLGRFTLTASENEYTQGDASNAFVVSSPGYMSINHDLGQPVDFDIRLVRSDAMRLAWFLPPARASLEGLHFINGDQDSDLTVEYVTGQWSFVFSGGDSGVSFVETFDATGAISIEADANGDFVQLVDETTGFAEFNGRIGDQNFRVFASFEGPGQGFIETELFFGGGGPDGPGDCPECPQALAEAFVSDGTIDLSNTDGQFSFDGSGEVIASFTVAVDSFEVALPAGANGVTLETVDADTGETITGDPLLLTRNGGFALVSYRDELGEMIEFHINDFGVDIQVQVYGAPGGGPDGPGPDGPGQEDMANPDFDGDGVMNPDDNCAVIANASQEDSDLDGLGDVCDIPVPDVSGIYLVDVVHSFGSEDYDIDTNSCVPQRNESLFVEIKMEGNQLFFAEIGEDTDLVGVVDANGGFDLYDPDAPEFATTQGAFDLASSAFSFSFTDVETDGVGGTIVCNVEANVTGGSPAEASEEVAFEAGVFWFEAAEKSDGLLEVEYGSVQLGSLESQFMWEFDTSIPAWLDVSDTAPMRAFVTDVGIEMADDRVIVDGFLSAGETAIIKLTSGGSVSQVREDHVDLDAFDIEGLSVFSVLDEAFDVGLADTEVFPSGSVAYAFTRSAQTDSYGFECDDQHAPADLVCKNMVPASFDAAGLPVPATSLDDVINSDSELVTGLLVGALWGGRGFDQGGEYSVDMHYVSSDGSIGGSELRVEFIKRYTSSMETMLLGSVPVTLVMVGSTEVLAFEVPKYIADIDDEERAPFIFVEAELEGSAIVRQGRATLAGEVDKDVLLNGVAGGFIRDTFSTSAVGPF